MSVRIRELVIKADLTRTHGQEYPASEKCVGTEPFETKVTLVEEFYNRDRKKLKER